MIENTHLVPHGGRLTLRLLDGGQEGVFVINVTHMCSQGKKRWRNVCDSLHCGAHLQSFKALNEKIKLGVTDLLANPLDLEPFRPF